MTWPTPVRKRSWGGERRDGGGVGGKVIGITSQFLKDGGKGWGRGHWHCQSVSQGGGGQGYGHCHYTPDVFGGKMLVPQELAHRVTSAVRAWNEYICVTTGWPLISEIKNASTLNSIASC